MAETTIVGAGLSGLVAGLTLAKQGRDVTILERESRIGGMPEFRPDPAGSPFDLARLAAYSGVDISPAAKIIDRSRLYAWGKCYEMPMNGPIKMYMVERGSRSTSLDTLLLNEATAAGVKVKFDNPVMTQGDYAMLPPDTIIATGLKIEPYEALNIPYSPLYGYYAKGMVDHQMTTVALYMDDFTKDYAFNCTINGAGFALLFQRDVPLIPTFLINFALMDEERVARGDVPPWAIEKMRYLFERQQAGFRHAVSRGVRVIMGTDSFNGMYPPAELAYLSQFGLGPFRAIQAATIDAARLLGISDIVGTLEPGKLADLVAVSGDPLAESELWRDPARVALVLQSGRVVADRRDA